MFKNILLTLLTFSFIFIASPTVSQAQEKSNLVLPPGTPLELVLIEEVYSQRNDVGDEVLFLLKEDLLLMGQTYLVKGTPVLGRVLRCKAGKSWGRSGSLEIEVFSISPPYGMPITLSEGLEKTQRSKTGKMILGLWAFGLLGGGVKGKKITIPAGTELTLFTDVEGTIADIPMDEMRRQTDEWLEKKIINNFRKFTWKRKCNVEQAFGKAQYTFDADSIVITPLEDFFYRLDVPVGSENASFIFRPFDDVHDGGTGFKPLKPDNDIAGKIMKHVK